MGGMQEGRGVVHSSWGGKTAIAVHGRKFSSVPIRWKREKNEGAMTGKGFHHILFSPPRKLLL